MEPRTNQGVFKNPTQSLVNSQFMSKVYLWMTVGIMLTGFVSYVVSNDADVFATIVTNRLVFYGLIAVEFALVIGLSAAIHKMNSLTAVAMFLLYSAINGATLSVIGMVYTQASIQSAFFTTTFSFAGLSIFGLVTKRDLGPVGNFVTMGLFGLVGFGLLSIFFPSMMGGVAGQVYGLVGIIVFAGLTAYDTQAIKNMAPYYSSNEESKKGAIIGALKLYMDFINLFLFILRMSGDRRK